MRRALSTSLSLAMLAAPLAAHVRLHQAQVKKIDKVEKLADGVYVLFAEGGGNMELIVTDKHAILVDDQFAPLAPQLLKTIRGITDKPIKYLINTHYHQDHAGANPVLAGQVQAIIATANARTRLAAQQMEMPADQRGGLPELALGDSDPKVRALLTLHLDDLEVHLMHPAGPGHTDGDLVVGIPSKHVIHMGDLFFNGLTPYIDLKAGGSVKAMRERADEFLAWLPEDAKVIPGHGPVGAKKDYARFRDFLKAVEAHVAAHPGASGAELDASFDHKAWSDYQGLGDFLTFAGFFDLAAGRQPKR
ncbi:MAG TPA: MBL fold metallo-hydrolase [Holophagaceae bacterium]|nr:MBL fold metallo-hydrolase [Holophagaceae bacterium]